MLGKFEIPAKSSRCKDYGMEDKRYVSGYDHLRAEEIKRRPKENIEKKN